MPVFSKTIVDINSKSRAEKRKREERVLEKRVKEHPTKNASSNCCVDRSWIAG